MKWNLISPLPLTPRQLEEDYRQARDLGRVRLGRQAIYFPRLGRVDCLPYSQVGRVWLRQEEVSAGLCCGRAGFDQFYLMVQDRSGACLRGRVLNKELGKQATALVLERSPGALLGKGEATPPPPGSAPPDAG